MIYLLTADGLKPGGSSTVHIYTQTIYKTTQLTTLVGRLSGIRTQSGKNKINHEPRKIEILRDIEEEIDQREHGVGQ